MNWNSISFDWNQIRGFLATVEEGSLSAGARALGLTQPTLGRQVAALEEALGVVLFERVGRSLVLTSAGADLVAHVRDMAEAAHRISMVASAQGEDIAGEVRITASEIMSVYVLPRVVERLAEIAPRLNVEIVASDEITDLQRREADIAVRHVRPSEPELIARMVMEPSANLYASTRYLERMGRPTTLEEVSALNYVSFGDKGMMKGFLHEHGVTLRDDQFLYGSTNGIVAWELVRKGLGMAIMSDFVADLTPEVEVALPAFTPIKFPIWLVSHRQLITSPRYRIVFDMLAEFYGSETGMPY